MSRPVCAKQCWLKMLLASCSVILNILCTLPERGATSPLKTCFSKLKQRLHCCWAKESCHALSLLMPGSLYLQTKVFVQMRICKNVKELINLFPFKWSRSDWQLFNQRCKNIAYLVHVPGGTPKKDVAAKKYFLTDKDARLVPLIAP